MSKNHKMVRIIRQLHSFEGSFAQIITNFAGSMIFVYVHIVWFSLWVIINSGLLEPFIWPFDQFPYGLLTMVVSLEAIFLSTFILVSQNRQALIDEYRELEEEKEEIEEDKEIDDIQMDLDEIKKAITHIQDKITKSSIK